jgi:CBS domain-containing protein
MTQSVQACNWSDNLGTAADIMWRNDCGVVPIIAEGRRVVGMITDRDICMAVATKQQCASEIPVGDVTSGAVYACGTEDDVRTALGIMEKKRVRRLPVVGPGGELRGILSINDLILRAQDARTKPGAEIATDDVMGVLKAVCQHWAASPVTVGS